MTHRQAPTAISSKIIHTTVQLGLTSCLVLVVVCVDMVRYTVEQRALLSESYVKCGSATNVRRKCRKFPGITGPAQQASINLLIKSGILGHFWTRNLLKNVVCETEENL
jgi:hypothetical protein